jgi:hypothetical protein
MSAPLSMSPCAELLWPFFTASNSGVSPFDNRALTSPPSFRAADTAPRSFFATASSSGFSPQAGSTNTIIAADSRHKF